MALSRACPERLRRVFLQGFSVMDVAEPLVSFDAERPAAEVSRFLDEHDYDLVGVRVGGLVDGYARREELEGGQCGDHRHAFVPDDLVSESASLAETIASLGANGRCFVRVLNGVSAIVTLSDLEKPPVRMYLFGMITILEMLVAREIRARFPEGTWTQYLSEGRRAKAEALLAERRRRNQQVELLDCLQFSDKAQVLVKDPDARRDLGYESRKSALQAAKELETLRNNLAHTQEIISSSWERIVRFSGNLDQMLRRLEGVSGPPA